MVEFRLRLYVSGDTTISRKAKDNITRLCESLQPHEYEVQVIDLLVDPSIAEKERILATPTLVHEHPIRPKRVIGDLSDMKRVLDFLGIEAGR